MKIYLFLKSKLLTFMLPQKVSGIFSFDEEMDNDSKLINVEARQDNWYIYSTDDVTVMNGMQIVDSLPLKEDNYYTLKRGADTYLIFTSKSFDKSFIPYTYNQDLNLIIGNDSSCTVNFASPIVKGVVVSIFYRNQNLSVRIIGEGAYLNNLYVRPSEQEYLMTIGTELNIYGLKVIILNGFLLINNPMNSVNCNLQGAHLNLFNIPANSEEKSVTIKDVDLYSPEDYFSKSPRIRRLIKTKEIDLVQPPQRGEEEKLPLLLTVGPMLTMGVSSCVMAVNNLSKLFTGQQTFAASWPSLATTAAMLVSTFVWPNISKAFNKKLKKIKDAEIIEKYTKYLNQKGEELAEESQLQKEILIENLIPVNQCINIINSGKINFWDKRIEQNDFLEVRIGVGDEKLDANVNYPEEGFSIDEDDLKKQADMLVEKYKYIKNVPIGYSIFDSHITALMGEKYKDYGLIHNIILQLITFYSYDDIKLVIFTNEVQEENWKYLRYLNHCFSNDRLERYYSTNLDSAKRLNDYLGIEIQTRLQAIQEKQQILKPHYIIITDDYSQIKNLPVIKAITEIDANLGFSLIIIENQMSRLPSKCNSFINLGVSSSAVLKDSFEAQDVLNFYDEIYYNINMMKVVQKLSNIPIEFQEGAQNLPESISFLEMEHVGKVEQLNIMNRWDMNDSTTSLKAEIGVDEEGNLMYLDLHEKAHGPHGLIAGMTGSGKSEFIITYILSMAVNYSPDEVAFILIDYKGGGLAFAFENKTTGVVLPHLAGTITNLDKAEMNRTLVSIDSEVKRRQALFNEARDILGESTIDIYKYQRFYKDGRLEEPVPHLFIICDEFAELKAQQPEFMDNLISIARIGRSLGVHLILATQKPSGVVNDQIWSNTKFRVCLKVQSTSDSNEMLKRPEAASLKQTGRFYLQVGYDEYFALGQSAWCGAKYYPSEKIVKQVDKSINFIDDTGEIVKSIQAGTSVKKVESQGEQLAAIMNNIIEVSEKVGKKTKRLWLNDIDPIILVDNLEKKYKFTPVENEIECVVGEYDAPELQQQGLLTYSLNKDGNLVILGNEEIERENLINTIVYSACKNHTAKELNIYIIDYGSEQIRAFRNFPQIGGFAFVGDDESFKNVFKLVEEELQRRKKLLIDYGGSIDNYNKRNSEKLSQILFILNNYESIQEIYSQISDTVITLARDCERYGIDIIITCNGISTLGRRIYQSFNTRYALHISDGSDYYGIFDAKVKTKPKDVLGRGLIYNGGIHEFQTASIVDEEDLNEFLQKTVEEVKKRDSTVAPPIPTLPEQVTLDIISKDISTINKVPIGISKNTLKTIKYDFSLYPATIISSNKLTNIDNFMDSLLDVLLKIQGLVVFFVDVSNVLSSVKEKKNLKYFDSNFDTLFDKFLEIITKPENKKIRMLYVFYGMTKLKDKATIDKVGNFFNEVKKSENCNMILVDAGKSLKAIDLDIWFTSIKNNADGIWVGKGFGDQTNFRVSKITKEMSYAYPNNYGFCIQENVGELIKLLEFKEIEVQEDEDEE